MSIDWEESCSTECWIHLVVIYDHSSLIGDAYVPYKPMSTTCWCLNRQPCIESSPNVARHIGENRNHCSQKASRHKVLLMEEVLHQLIPWEPTFPSFLEVISYNL